MIGTGAMTDPYLPLEKQLQNTRKCLEIALMKEITGNTKPSELLSKYQSNRFVKPFRLSPVKVKQVEIAMLGMAEKLGFSPVLLSPASPLGSCSVIAKVDQNNVISATRGVELIADSTNMLAIYLADGLKRKTMDNTTCPIYLTATCRATRSQLFPSETHVSHFGLFTLVSSGKDTGSYGFEKAALAKQLGFYLSYFGDNLGYQLKVGLNVRNGYPDKTGFVDRIHHHLVELYPKIDFTINKEVNNNSYY